MPVRPLPALRGLASAGALLGLLCLACASNPSAGGPGTYRGVFVSPSETGIFDVTVEKAPSSPFPASGTITFPDRIVSLSGSLDQSKGALFLSSPDGDQMTGESRPKYIFGTDQTGTSSFGLFLVPADGTPMEFLCGNYVLTSTTGTSPLPFAVTAVAPGAAICVGPGFTWFGSLDATGTLSCSVTFGIFDGNVNFDGGNQWQIIDVNGNDDYGTWTLAACSGNSAGDGGVEGAAEAGASSTPDGGVNGAIDGGADSPANSGQDADLMTD